MDKWCLYEKGKEEVIKITDVTFDEVIEVTKTYRKKIHTIGNFKNSEYIKIPVKMRHSRFRKFILCNEDRSRIIEIIIDNDLYDKNETIEFKVIQSELK